MTADELADYYRNLLILQYKGQPKARATIKALAKEAIGEPLTLFPDVRDVWDLETAVGAQLDILGNVHGLKRYINNIDLSKDYFGMPQMSLTPTPDDPDDFFGFIAYADIPVGGYPITPWYWENYRDVTVMDDNTYRRFIKYIILLRTLDCTLDNIDWLFDPSVTKTAPDGTLKNVNDWFAPSIDIWGDIPTPIYVDDNEDMTITYNIDADQSGTGYDNVMLISAIKEINAFPKPAGVQLIIVG